MAVSGDPVVILHMIWERDCNQPIHNLIKEAKAGICILGAIIHGRVILQTTQ